MKRHALMPGEYARLCERKRRAAGYRCQGCGALGPLQVHHIVKRSAGGGDVEDNLRVLCVGCHKAEHPHMP